MRIGIGGVKATGTALQSRGVGHALLVHAKGEPDPRAVAFATRLAPDPQHTLAVVDLPFGTLEASAESLARHLTPYGPSLRLVFGRATAQEARRTAQHVAERLDRLVLAADGSVLPTTDGGLFVPSDHGAGWLRYRPGRTPERDSQRFPKPRWEFSTFDRPWTTSSHAVVEPVPSGVWLHNRSTDAFPGGRQWLVDHLPSHQDILTAVLGAPGCPPLPLTDVIRWWDTVLPSARSWVRFLHFGPVALPDTAESLGQHLADTLRQQVVLYAGLPVTPRRGLDSPDVVSVASDGTLGARPFVSELMYFPRTSRSAPPPALFGLRAPVHGVPEITTGVYEYASDAVLEVVQSGLWMRPHAEPADGDAVRRIPATPGYAAILYDRSVPGTEDRMRSLAEDMLWKLDPDTREAFTVAPADEPGVRSGPAEDAYLWSPQDPAASGPQAVVAPARGGHSRPADIAPWTPESAVPEQEAQEHTAAPQDATAGPASALARLNPDDPSHASVVSRTDTTAPAAPAPAPTPQSARTETDAPSTPLPGTESDASEPAVGDEVADVSHAAVATSGTAADQHVTPAPATPLAPGPALTPEPTPAPVPQPDAPRAEPERAPEPPPTGNPLPYVTPDAERQDPVPSGPTPAPAAVSGAKLPDLPVASEPPGAPEPPHSPEPPRVPQAGPGEAAAPPPVAAPVTPAPAAPEPPRPASPSPSPSPSRMIRLESDSPAAAPPRAAEPDPAARPGASAGPAGPSDAGPGPAAGPVAAPRAAAAGVRVQPVPKTSACAVPPERGTSQERDWVRRTFSTQYNAVAGTVSRVMSESPGLRGGSRGEAADALTDLVAVRLYLSGDSAQVDEAVRSAAVGPHVPLARCVAAGLRRLPSYRGAALLRARTTGPERDWYREGRLATEWAFCTAHSAPRPGPEDGTDFLIWSMTARRTALIDPAEPFRVVFLPGTTFKVLRASDGEGPVLIRELSPSEVDGEGKVDVQRVPLDEIALDGLERAVTALRQSGEATTRGKRGGEREDGPLATPPGLIGGARVRRPGADGDVSVSDEGAKL
ncbi:hypothetical protein K7472_29110 [Streptomyces sp. PTM05]|uniref:ADP-ribosyltransferase exoenzyme n=1 Tax=Streptantibioticus parmotrematis TaxID=2873249 RepID=A0ABS7R091_9ACTN|nr:hypothetical protein [Streptantibioticus parmotrematis]MBY8888875.1 hypothetical protein [Streptantibioticus parmotrematis]